MPRKSTKIKKDEKTIFRIRDKNTGKFYQSWVQTYRRTNPTFSLGGKDFGTYVIAMNQLKQFRLHLAEMEFDEKNPVSRKKFLDEEAVLNALERKPPKEFIPIYDYDLEIVSFEIVPKATFVEPVLNLMHLVKFKKTLLGSYDYTIMNFVKKLVYNETDFRYIIECNPLSDPLDENPGKFFTAFTPIAMTTTYNNLILFVIKSDTDLIYAKMEMQDKLRRIWDYKNIELLYPEKD